MTENGQLIWLVAHPVDFYTPAPQKPCHPFVAEVAGRIVSKPSSGTRVQLELESSI